MVAIGGLHGLAEGPRLQGERGFLKGGHHLAGVGMGETYKVKHILLAFPEKEADNQVTDEEKAAVSWA